MDEDDDVGRSLRGFVNSTEPYGTSRLVSPHLLALLARREKQEKDLADRRIPTARPAAPKIDPHRRREEDLTSLEATKDSVLDDTSSWIPSTQIVIDYYLFELID